MINLGMMPPIRFKHWRIFLLVYAVILLYVYKNDPSAKMDIVIGAKNYFQKEHDAIHLSKRLLINTSKCHIPTFPLWNNDTMEARKYYRKLSFYTKCKDQPRLTRVKKNKLLIDENALGKLKLTLADVTCCYRTIERMEQNYKNYNFDADNHYGFSRKCHRMQRQTTITSRFIHVLCYRHVGENKNKDDDVATVYQNFHAVPLIPSLLPDCPENVSSTEISNISTKFEMENRRKPQPSSFWKSDAQILKKIQYWARCEESNFSSLGLTKEEMEGCQRILESGPLPHVLIIGIESISRMSFRRFMNKSVKVLKSVGAVEMKGFSKVGHDALSNILPLMTSISVQEAHAYSANASYFDNFPFLWKDFHSQNYITAHLEDSPMKAIFNHKRTGFVKAPVDFYLRPFMLAAYMNGHKTMLLDKGRSINCIGYERPEDIVLNFTWNLIKSAERNHTPTFTLAWLSDLTHSKHNTLELLDDKLSRVIEKLKKSWILSKTVFLVLGDHGRRTGSFRRTLTGWHEEKLPVLWISIPKSYRKRLHFQDALKHNSRQLVTPYDIHATLKHVLLLNKDFSSSINQNEARPGPQRGISLFAKHPPRSCKEAFIPRDHCPCNLQTDIHIGRRVLKKAIEAANQALDNLLPKQCHRLSLDIVFGTAVLVHPKNMNGSGDHLRPGDILVLLSKSKLGDVFFESGVQYRSTRPIFRNTTYFVRTNEMDEAPHCLNVNHPMTKFCICDRVRGSKRNEKKYHKDLDHYNMR